MKKTLIALAAVAVTGAASAQVTLYGVMDMNYGTSTTKDAAGAKTAATAQGMSSGGLSGSRWGMKGSEDLGGGLSANFQLESAIAANSGASTGFTRTSMVGLSGGFGTLGLGRQYTPSFSAVGATDIDGTSAFSTSNLFANGVRASDAFIYTTPSMGGVSVKLGVVNGKVGANDETKVSGTDVSVTYAAGPLMLTAASSSVKGKTPAVTGVNANGSTVAQVLAVAAVDGKVTGTVVGGSYDFGAAKVMVNFISSKVTDNLAAANNTKFTEQNIGVKVPMGAISLVAGYGKNKQTLGALSAKTSDNVLGLNYALSKRTDAYFRVSKTGVIDDAVKAGKVNNTAVGIRHTF